MKKIFMVFGIIFLVLIVAIVGFAGFAAYAGAGLDKSSKAYVDQTIPIIVSNWSKDEVLKRASPQLKQIISEHPQEFQQLFDKLSRLGALQHYDGAKGQATVFFDSKQGKIISAKYVADASFAHGQAHIAINLIQLAGHWQLLLFHVNSPLFLQ